MFNCQIKCVAIFAGMGNDQNENEVQTLESKTIQNVWVEFVKHAPRNIQQFSYKDNEQKPEKKAGLSNIRLQKWSKFYIDYFFELYRNLF